MDTGPVTQISAETLRRLGVATGGEILKYIAASSPETGTAQVIGGGSAIATASMRAMGSTMTLVLLNGHRLGPSAVDGISVDLNMIPVAALERVEVLRDGAAALLGGSAVAGVINFVTKEDYKGGSLELDADRPMRRGGAQSGLTLTLGEGDLSVDGFHWMSVINLHHTDAVASRDRPCCSRLILPERGLDLSVGTANPANYSQTQTVVDADGLPTQVTYRANPAFPTCQVGAGNGSYDPKDGGSTCRFNTARYEDLLPASSLLSALAVGSRRLDAGTTVRAEAQFSRHQVRYAMAPVSIFGLSMDASSRYFPGQGITPAPTQFVIDPTQAISLNWRSIDLGPAKRGEDTRYLSLLAAVEGNSQIMPFDLHHEESVQAYGSRVISLDFSGYSDTAVVADGVARGILNPFGTVDAAGKAFLDAAAINGIRRTAQGSGLMVQSRLWGAMPTGLVANWPSRWVLALELGADRLNTDTNTAYLQRISVTPAYDTTHGQRESAALQAGWFAKPRADLEASLNLRADHFSDVGSQLVYKAALAWSPTADWRLSISHGTGFRAPSLVELHGGNQLDWSRTAYNDPLLCPNGQAVPGADPNSVCGQLVQLLTGSNPTLRPERTVSNTLGVNFKPDAHTEIEVDLWQVRRPSGGLFYLSADQVFNDPSTYAGHLVRAPNGLLSYVDLRVSNTGGMSTDGLDIAWNGQWAWPQGWKAALSLNASYIHSFRSQYALDPYQETAGDWPRWQHVLTGSLQRGDIAWQLSHRWVGGYRDQNLVAPEFYNRVGAWSVFDGAVTWQATADVNLSLGVHNLFDTAPPFSNQTQVFQVGYDPRVSDPTGRSLYARAAWSFK